MDIDITLPSTPLESLSFAGLCTKLDKIRHLSSEKMTSKARSTKMQKIIFGKDVTRARKAGENIYCYVRLLLPVSDKRDRGPYGIKAQKLSTIFLKALDLTESGEDGKLIKNWKEGAITTRSAAIEADLATKIREVVARRAVMFDVGRAAANEAGAAARASGRGPTAADEIATSAAAAAKGKWTLSEANEWLDRVAKAYAGGMAAAEGRDMEAEANADAGAGAGADVVGVGSRYDVKKFIDDSNYVPLFKEMLGKCGSCEVGWLASMILLDLRIGLKSSTVLKWFHMDASDHFSVNASLRTVLSSPELSDPERRCKGSIKLGIPFDPMRADKLNFVKPQVLNKDFIIEQKLDGERLLIHYRRAVPGAVLEPDLKAWSRAKLPKLGYAKTLREHFLAALSPDVTELVLDGELVAWDKTSETPLPLKMNRRFSKAERYAKRSNGEDTGGGGGGDDDEGDEDADDFGGDGDELLLRTLPGDNLVHHSIHYFAFDCLWLTRSTQTPSSQGRPLPSGDLTQLPLRERRLALAAALPRDVLGHFKRLAPLYTCIGLPSEIARKRIDEALLESHARLEEGIVIKELDRPYEFHRSSAQLKLKPEYVSGVNENLDVVVVGGYCIEGASWRTTAVTAAQAKFGQTLVWVFLCAMPRWASPQAKGRGDDPIKWAPLCVASSGVKPSDAPWLLEKLGPHWFKAPEKGPMPDWLCGWKPSSSMRPNFLIEPKNSIVLELKGSELIDSDSSVAAVTTREKSKITVTVRFPRIATLRQDKSTRDADTEEDLSVIWNERGGKMIKKSMDAVGGKRKRSSGAATGPAPRRGPQLLPAFAVDSTVVRVRTNVFNNDKVIVLPHDDSEFKEWAATHFQDEADRVKWGSRLSLIQIIKSLGGNVVMLVPPEEAAKTTYIGVGKLGSALGLRVSSVAPAQADIFSPAWLFDALAERQRPVQVRPAHFVRASPAMSQQLMRIVDTWGDEHASPALEPDAVRSLLLRVIDSRARVADADVADATALIASCATHTFFRTVRFQETSEPRVRPPTAHFPAIGILDSDATGEQDHDARQAGLKAWTIAAIWRDYGGRVSSNLGPNVDVIFVDAKRYRPGDLTAALTRQPCRAPIVDVEWIRASVTNSTPQPLGPYTLH